MAKKSKINRRVYSENNFALIDEYLDSFKRGCSAFVSEDKETFAYFQHLTRQKTLEIASKFHIPHNEVCKVANEYKEITHLINGVFTRSECDHLYFIKGGEFIKIGRTEHLKTRMAALQISSPDKLELLKVFTGRGLYEFKIHDLFSHIRVNGEWFKDTKELREYIALLSLKNSD